MINKVIHTDVLSGMKLLADKSINSVITSPPYWQLRDYGFAGQWGLEPTFQEYLEHLWLLMDEIWRVLKDDGTVWINLGDTYGTQSGQSRGKKYYSTEKFANVAMGDTLLKGKVKSKCLLLIPHRFAIGCIERGWIMRNDIIWAKRNGMPESVTDRFSKKHEYIFFMAKNQKYYFDLDGIRDKHSEVSLKRNEYGRSEYGDNIVREFKPGDFCNEKGKNPGSVSDFWDITLKGGNAEHYAAYNDKLIVKPILAGCPKGGIVLDPFAGTGTTLVTAINFGRQSIGFEGNSGYVDIANKRIATHTSQYKLI